MSAYSSLSDLDLFKRVSAYDSKALESLYDRYSSLLYTVIKKIVQKENAAEEILTDVFTIIWRKLEYFDFNTGNVYTWIITLARNKAVDYVRRNRQDNPVTAEYNDDYENKYIVPRLSPQIDSLDIATAISLKGNIEQALSNLTDAQKYVIHLAYYEGYTQAGIAARLNIPLQTVKSKVQIALSNLKDNLIRGNQ